MRYRRFLPARSVRPFRRFCIPIANSGKREPRGRWRIERLLKFHRRWIVFQRSVAAGTCRVSEAAILSQSVQSDQFSIGSVSDSVLKLADFPDVQMLSSHDTELSFWCTVVS